MLEHRLLPVNPCPRCGSELRLIIEAEYRGRRSIVSYSYVCTTCRHKEKIEQLDARLDSDKLLISRVKYIR